jgi:hypothetical protein
MADGKKFSWKGIASFGLVALAAAFGVIIANTIITPGYNKVKSKFAGVPKIKEETKKETV